MTLVSASHVQTEFNHQLITVTMVEAELSPLTGYELVSILNKNESEFVRHV